MANKGGIVRIMVSNRTKMRFKVVAHYVTFNGWEYYLTQRPDSRGIGEAWVMGIEAEFGTFDIKEITTHIAVVSSGAELNEILPATGFSWEGESQISNKDV